MLSAVHALAVRRSRVIFASALAAGVPSVQSMTGQADALRISRRGGVGGLAAPPTPRPALRQGVPPPRGRLLWPRGARLARPRPAPAAPPPSRPPHPPPPLP